MARVNSKFVCQQCGYSQVGWSGKCPNCDSWGSLVETIDNSNQKSLRRQGHGGQAKAGVQKKSQSLSKVENSKVTRISTKIDELDRVLGSGFVPGQVVLLAGEPGIGKSTLLLQLSDKIGGSFYASGEESAGQVKVRAERLGIDAKKIIFIDEINVDNIISEIEGRIESNEKPYLVIIDSIQTMETDDLSGASGSVGQVRECTSRLLRLAKDNDIPTFIVGHVTKQGSVAGPATLAHMVDTVLWFEGDKNSTLRILRAVKNRFGPTDEIGVFEMEDKGLRSNIDFDKLFLTGSNLPGSVVSVALQGTRPIPIEVQCLVVPTKMAFPKRIAQGIDTRRLEVIIAILTRRCGIPLYESDVFVNIAGGISIKDPSIDIAVALSIASAYLNISIPKKLASFGEIGLLGEIRSVVMQERRIKEAKRLGFTRIVTSKEFTYVNEAIRKLLK